MRADAMHTAVSKTPARTGRIVAAALAFGLLWAVTGCTTQQKAGDSSSYLTILSLTAAPGDKPDEQGTVLLSDVQTSGEPLADPMVVTMRLGLKDPSFPTTPTNYITVQHYSVHFSRTDGGQAPADFSGSATFTVTTSDTASGPIVLVPAQAKTLPPLVGLIGQGESKAIPVTAQVTFDGVDQAGKATSVTGFISISFADRPDTGDSTSGQASFFASNVRVGLQAQFDAQASTVPSGRTIQSYEWNFGDGTIETSTGPTKFHIYQQTGVVTVRLTVTDSTGQKFVTERFVTVTP